MTTKYNLNMYKHEDDDDIEVDIDTLLSALDENVKKDVKDFTDIINLDGQLKREIFIPKYVDGYGPTVNGYIRFWNAYDDKHNTPVEEREPIKIYIDSCGGDTYDALMIMDSIMMSKTPVWTIGLGKVFSSGFEIFYTGHKRIIYPHASLMWHEGRGGAQGDAHKLINNVKQYEKDLEVFKLLLLTHTKITEEFFNEHHKDDVFFSPEEAIEYGIADEIAKEFI